MILNNTQVQRTRAFTLIEIMIAIAVIAILVGILFIAGRGVFSSSAGKATTVNLSVLKGMLGEFDSKTRLATSPLAYRWLPLNSSSSVTMPNAPNTPLPYDVDFWRVPYLLSTVLPGNPIPPGAIDTMDAPGLVTVDSAPTRNASRQILNTQLVMNLLLSMPSNRTVIQNMTADHYMVLTYQSGNLNSPGGDGVLYTSDDTASTDPILYMPGNKVGGFMCINPIGASSTPMAGSDWATNSQISPVLLDGWGNPIIFVPGSGLRVRLLNGAKDYNDTTPGKVLTAIIISPEGKVDSTTTPPKVLVPGRPFWASAGPDGDFAKGDDNIYSFNQ